MRFTARTDAGRQRGARLRHHADRTDVLVPALPRGAEPVAAEAAAALHAPPGVQPVRTPGVPGQSELAMGATASGGHTVR